MLRRTVILAVVVVAALASGAFTHLRLPEEKRRGITLDLGFAHLERDGVEIGFVDVPGHERLLHNALAGLGGVRLLLLVVAADEGVRAQTREHLEVARQLAVPQLVVALTRIDLVSAEQADVAELEIEELLAPTGWAGAPVFRVSSRTGGVLCPASRKSMTFIGRVDSLCWAVSSAAENTERFAVIRMRLSAVALSCQRSTMPTVVRLCDHSSLSSFDR